MTLIKNPAHSALGLDLLRGIAALIVFAAHLRGGNFVEFGALDPASQTLVTKLAFAVTRMGHEAVLAFFVLSGYLVGGQVIRRLRAGTFNLPHYAIDRAVRIFLPLIPAVLLTLAVTVFAYHEIPDVLQALGNMAGLNGILVETLKYDGPLWSIAYEIWFYILAGMLGWIMMGQQRLGLALALVICGFAVFMVLDTHFLLFWCLGALVVFYVETPRKYLWMGLGLICFVLGSFCWQMSWASNSMQSVTYLPAPVSELLVAAAFCLMIPALSSQQVSNYLAFLARPITYLSGISYSLYLLHYPILSALDAYFPRATQVNAESMSILGLRAITVVIGVNIMWYLFERNTARIRKYCKEKFIR